MTGAARVDGGLTYRMEIKDNVTKVAKQGAAAQKDLGKAIKGTQQTMEQQTLSFISNVMAITALEGGINAIAESFAKLGIGSEKFIAGMRKAAAVTKLFTGTAQLIQGLIGVHRLLLQSEIALAGVESFRKVLHNPWMMAGVIAGAAGAGAVGGYLARGATGGDTNNTQIINFNSDASESDKRHMARESHEIMGFG